MRHQWVANYYIANRWGAMVEKTRIYSGRLARNDVIRNLDNHLDRLRASGTPVYPQYDLQQEKVA